MLATATVAPDLLGTNIDTARYVLSAGAQAVAAIFGLVVTVTFVVSQTGRYRIPTALLAHPSIRDAAFYGCAIAGILAPLIILHAEWWHLTWVGLVPVVLAVVLTVPFVQSRTRMTDPAHYTGAASRHPDAIRELAMQALEQGDHELFTELMNALATATTPPVTTQSAFSIVPMDLKSDSYAMASALPWLLLSPRFPRESHAAVRAVGAAILSACSPQNPRASVIEQLSGDAPAYVRGNPRYALRHRRCGGRRNSGCTGSRTMSCSTTRTRPRTSTSGCG